MADVAFDTAKLAALRTNLEQFPARLAKNVLRSSLRRGATVVRDQARANFRPAGSTGGEGPQTLTGALRASIRVAARRGTPTRVVVQVVAGELTTAQKKRFGVQAAFYAFMVEKGHINRKLGQALRGSKAGVRAARAASTSNTPAHPFMRPAIEAKAAAVIDTIASTVQSRLDEGLK
jgi:HK97 gp10 family phage protein